MSDITAEKRLELIRNIREANHKNRMTLRAESIFYTGMAMTRRRHRKRSRRQHRLRIPPR